MGQGGWILAILGWKRKRPRPRIGVTGAHRGGIWMWWFNRLSLWLLGARAVRITPRLPDPDFATLDGLLIGGGDNISAELYEGEIIPDVRVDPKRDEMELKALNHAIPTGMPVLGVCRGAQLINVHFGGALDQDIFEKNKDMPHMWSPLPRKRVSLDRQARLYALMGSQSFRVNSLHRQAISELGEDIRVAGRDEYGVIQAVETTQDQFIFGVQWHPEFIIYKRAQRRLFRALVDAAHIFAGNRPDRK